MKSAKSGTDKDYWPRQAATLKSTTTQTYSSLQTIATETGLSKSAVQQALRHLKRRRLIDQAPESTSANPVRQVLQPWLR